MRPHLPSLVALSCATLVATSLVAQSTNWRQHDPDRPRPPVITPGATVGAAPSDATVLFDGSSLDAWRGGRDGAEPARWRIRDGYMEAAPGTGAIQTAMPLGDMQLHIEWATPTPPTGRGQGRGNSGVIIMGKYEVQILDSYENTTYADGQAAAVYGQFPPLVNASRPPGAWQSYDIVFRGPRWNPAGALTRPARVTVLHNGVLVQENVSLWGGTSWLRHVPYARHPDRLPLVLQDHSNPVRFRNIWVRNLPEETAAQTHAGEATDAVARTSSTLARFVGTYRAEGNDVCRVVLTHGVLGVALFDRPDTMPLVSTADGDFTFRYTGGRVHFTSDGTAPPTRLSVSIAEVERTYARAP